MRWPAGPGTPERKPRSSGRCKPTPVAPGTVLISAGPGPRKRTMPKPRKSSGKRCMTILTTPSLTLISAEPSRALLSQNLVDQAEQELRKAVRLDPENPS